MSESDKKQEVSVKTFFMMNKVMSNSNKTYH